MTSNPAKNDFTPPPAGESDFRQIARHSLNLLLRKIWIILGVGPLVAIGSMALMLKFGFLKPELPATVLIGMDRPLQELSPNSDNDIGSKKIELIRSRNFLNDVADRLSLCFVMKDFQRSELLDSVWVDVKADSGKYRLSIDKTDKKSFEILYLKKKSEGPDPVLFKGNFDKAKTVQLPTLFLAFNPAYLEHPRSFDFSILSRREITDWILKRLTIERPVNRKENFFSATLTGRDYSLVTKTVNTIADLFLEKNTNYQKRRIRETLEMLSKQLEMAKSQLSNSENSLRDFLSANPAIAIGQETDQALRSMVVQQSGASEMENLVQSANALRNQFKDAYPEERERIAGEILEFLTSNKWIGAGSYQEELARLSSEKQELERSYAKNHPMVQQNQNRILEILGKTDAAMNDFIYRTGQNIARNRNNLQYLSGKLRSLPQKNQRFADLKRLQQIDSASYSFLLGRLNQAKVEDAAEASNIFIMDYGVEPLPPSPLVRYAKLIFLGLLSGVLASVVPVLLTGYFRKTAYNEFELKRLTALPVLESVPFISLSKRADRKSALSPVLITGDIVPSFAKEVFRSLRTKLLLELNNSKEKSVIITGLESGSGKSMVAVNLAIALAHHNLSTLLVDGDLTRGILHRFLGLKSFPGLSDFLMEENQKDKSSFPEFIQSTHVPGLSFMCSGKKAHSPGELITRIRLEHLLAQTASRFNVLVFDAPPFGVSADSVVVNDLFSKSIVVAGAGLTNIEDLEKKINEYPPLKERILGIVLNRASMDERF